MILRTQVAARLVVGERGTLQHGCQVHSACLPVRDRTVGVKQFVMTDRLVERAEPELCQVLAHLLSDELHEGLDELRLAGEPRPQDGVLRGDTDRTGVEMTDTHHDASGNDQRSGGESELLVRR